MEEAHQGLFHRDAPALLGAGFQRQGGLQGHWVADQFLRTGRTGAPEVQFRDGVARRLGDGGHRRRIRSGGERLLQRLIPLSLMQESPDRVLLQPGIGEDSRAGRELLLGGQALSCGGRGLLWHKKGVRVGQDLLWRGGAGLPEIQLAHGVARGSGNGCHGGGIRCLAEQGLEPMVGVGLLQEGLKGRERHGEAAAPPFA